MLRKKVGKAMLAVVGRALGCVVLVVAAGYGANSVSNVADGRLSVGVGVVVLVSVVGGCSGGYGFRWAYGVGVRLVGVEVEVEVGIVVGGIGNMVFVLSVECVGVGLVGV